MKILFLNPPFLPKFSREQRSPAVTKSGTVYYPMWLSYAAGAALQAGHDVQLVDCPADERWPWDRLLQTVAAEPYELAVIAASTPSLANDASRAAALREAQPGLRTVLVGPHVSALPEETLTAYPALDGVLRGEYEATVVELADVLAAGGDPATVAGVTWRRDGELVAAPDRPLDDPDRWPFVAQTYERFLDVRNYFYAHSLYPIVTILSARGCPNYCIYCVYPQTFSGHNYRPRATRAVVDEFRFIKKTWPQVREVMFEDDTFSIDHERTREVCEALVVADLRLPWSANARCDLDLPTLQLMRRAGCRLLCVGVESGSGEMLASMKKRIDRAQIERFFADASRAGIMIHGCFMVGNPGETRATMEETLTFAKRLRPDTAQFFPVMAYPGTALYRWAEQHDFIRAECFADWLTPEGQHNCVIDRPDLPAAELVAFCDRARREFYLSPRYLARKFWQVLTHPGELKRTWRSGKRFLGPLLRGTR
ncbi:MAG: cobalamin-dependent protein [Candidatus Coatesbacteria bacterium]|nr:MAG: cobalamin-dependent protein [Candidatus Coatesbacteria bacterium]